MDESTGSNEEAKLLSPETHAEPDRRALMKRLGRVLVLLVLVQAAFSGYTIVVTLTVVHEHLNPVVFSLFRDVGGGTVLLAASRWTYGSWHAPLKEDIGWFLLVGVLGVYVGQMFMVFALQYVRPYQISMFQLAQPVLTVAFAALFAIEPLQVHTTHGRCKVGGIALAVTGAAIAIGLKGDDKDDNGSSGGGGVVLGYMFLLAQVVALASHSIA